MRIMKILLCGLLMALPVFAEETEDRQTATSLHYVSHELDTRQNKLTAGTNAALTYTNTAGGVGQRTVKENLNGGTTDTSLPQVNAVNAGLDTKQNDIATIDDHTAVTYTSQVGTIGQKGIYQTDGTYAAQSDNLIDAKTFNAALKNALDSEFVCADRPDAYAPGTNTCWLWQIHEGIRVPYISATGTVTQNGTPTPTSPIEPVFYRQGDMILRRVGDYADSYDATTHKITRRVGEKMFNGTENWRYRDDLNGFLINVGDSDIQNNDYRPYCTHLVTRRATDGFGGTNYVKRGANSNTWFFFVEGITTVPEFKQWLADQYADGTPVTLYYLLVTPTEEDWTETTYNENVYLPQNQ